MTRMNKDEFGEILVRNNQFQVPPSPKMKGSRKSLSMRSIRTLDSCPKTTGSIRSRRSMVVAPLHEEGTSELPPPPPMSMSPPKSRKTSRASATSSLSSSMHKRSSSTHHPRREQQLPSSFSRKQSSSSEGPLPPMSPMSPRRRRKSGSTTTTMTLKPKSLARLSMIYDGDNVSADTSSSRWDATGTDSSTRRSRSSRNLLITDSSWEADFDTTTRASTSSLSHSIHSAPPMGPQRTSSSSDNVSDTSKKTKKGKKKTKKISEDVEVAKESTSPKLKTTKKKTGSPKKSATDGKKCKDGEKKKDDKEEKRRSNSNTSVRKQTGMRKVSSTSALDKEAVTQKNEESDFFADFPSTSFPSFNDEANKYDDVWNAGTDDFNNKISDPWHVGGDQEEDDVIVGPGQTGTMKLKDESFDNDHDECDCFSAPATPKTKTTSSKKMTIKSALKKKSRSSRKLSPSLHDSRTVPLRNESSHTASTESVSQSSLEDCLALFSPSSNSHNSSNNNNNNNLDASTTSFHSFEEDLSYLGASSSSLDAVAVFQTMNDVPNWMKRRIEAKIRSSSQH